jgi:phosphate-selective porin
MTIRAIAVVMLAASVLAPFVARADDTVSVSSGEKGFGFRNADGSFEFRLKGLLQTDVRFFDASVANDTFVLRRLEPAFELTLGTLAYFKLQPQFAGDTATASDVFGELRFTPAATLRFGKFKTPLALEYLQSSSALAFIERGLPTEVGAGRDFGVQLQGELPGGTSYAIAWLNGAPDGRDAAGSDTDDRKEVARGCSSSRSRAARARCAASASASPPRRAPSWARSLRRPPPAPRRSTTRCRPTAHRARTPSSPTSAAPRRRPPPTP